MTETRGEAVGAITRLPIERVHPDPLQPRKNVDSDLAESIRHNGQQVPITVWVANDGKGLNGAQFVILNGERRYRGCIAAGLTDIDVMIVPEPSKAERMLKQVIANQGKALTPIEEAFAFRQIMTDSKISQNELSKQLGIPRSTVGDRIRLIELAPYWLDLIKEDKLQVAHAAILHRYRDVPEPYQEKAYTRAMNPQQSYRIGGRIKDGELVQVKGFEHELFPCFLPHLKATFRVPGYTGPTITTTERSPADWSRQCPSDWKGEYACDPKAWGTIYRAAQKEAKKNNPAAASSRSSYDSRPHHQQVVEATAKANKLAVRKDAKLEEGEKVVWGQQGWEARDGCGWEFKATAAPLDGRLFMSSCDKAKLVAIVDGYSSCLVSSDVKAVEDAKLSFATKKQNAALEAVAEAKTAIDDLDGYDLFGPGALEVVRLADSINNGKHARQLLAMATDVDLSAIFVEREVPAPWECDLCGNEEGKHEDDEDGPFEIVKDAEHPLLCTLCIAENPAATEQYAELEAEHEEQEPTIEVTVPEDVDAEQVERLAKALLGWMRGAVKVPTDDQLTRDTIELCNSHREEEVTVRDEDPAESGGEETSDEEMEERFGDEHLDDDDIECAA